MSRFSKAASALGPSAQSKLRVDKRYRRSLFILLAAAAASVAVVGSQASANATGGFTAAQIAQFTALDSSVASVLDAPLAPSLDPPTNFHSVTPHTYDPAHTDLVGAKWVDGTGCPTASPVAIYPATSPTGTYTDPGCTTGDPSDNSNWGLLLSKNGPTPNNAAAVAELHNPKGIVLTELGYDIRKNGGSFSALGSHCGAGAPRFDIVTTDGVFFLGCNSPPPSAQVLGQGWTRLRWGGAPLMAFGPSGFGPITGAVQRVVIVFDEGTDIGPDFFGAAMLDNIDVNGTLVGHA
jgi:hypothetical protein